MLIDRDRENQRCIEFGKKWDAILESMGFHQCHMFRYENTFYQVTVDFSATHEKNIISVAIMRIYEAGVNSGEKRIKRQFHELMELPEE